MNLFENIPSHLEDELADILLLHENIKIEKIVSQGHSSPKQGWYDQEENEWVILLEGEATLVFKNGKTLHMKKGDFLNIPAHEKHKVIYTSSEPKAIWLAIFF